MGVVEIKLIFIRRQNKNTILKKESKALDLVIEINMRRMVSNERY